MNIAQIYESKGEILKSLEFNKQALKLSQANNVIEKEGVANNNLANNYKFLGDLPKAVHHYLESRNIYERTNNYWGAVGSLNNLGLLLIENKDYPKAKEYLDEALDISIDADLFQEQVMTLFNLSVYNKTIEQPQEAIDALQKALEIIEEKRFFFMKPFAKIEIGINLLKMDRLSEAEEFLNDGFIESQENGRIEDKVTSHLYMSFLKEKQNKWREAESYAENGYKMATDLQKQDLTAVFAQQLVKIYKHFSRTEEALAMYEKQTEIEKIVYNDENARALINQEYQYSYTQKAYQDSLKNDAKLQIQAADLERRKMTNWFLVGHSSIDRILWSGFDQSISNYSGAEKSYCGGKE